MIEPWTGIERRLQRLDECVARLTVLAEDPRTAFDADPVLRDVAERNFEVAAQCVIDIAMRIRSLEQAPRTSDAAEAIRGLSELGVVPSGFAKSLSPLAGFRNVLAHEYLDVDWDVVFAAFSKLGDLQRFAAAVRAWLARRPTS
jgi:uncharacterized protein YutE (UPF0331/DUF86 family)